VEASLKTRLHATTGDRRVRDLRRPQYSGLHRDICRDVSDGPRQPQRRRQL